MSKDVDKNVLEMVKGDSSIVALNRGFRVRVSQLPISVFDAIINRFPMPDPPEVELAEKGRTEPNPNDPDYIRQCGEVEMQRGQAILTAICLLCVEPVDPIPPNEEWVPQLTKLGEITGIFDIKNLDLTDELDRKLAFLKYCAIGRSNVGLISRLAHLGEEAIRQAEETFRRDTERLADSAGQG